LCRIADAFSKLINDKCVKAGAVPNGQCTPNAVYLDSGCLVEVLPRLSPKPLTNLTATEAAPVVTAFVALQAKCATLTDQVPFLCTVRPVNIQTCASYFGVGRSIKHGLAYPR
jgi:hypothetical protein